MDFRLSIMRFRDRSGLCMVPNWFGRYYLSSITPFCKFRLRKLMAMRLLLSVCRAHLVRGWDVQFLQKKVRFDRTSRVAATSSAALRGSGGAAFSRLIARAARDMAWAV